LVPLLNPRTKRARLLRAAVPAVFCLLVFFFALHAKTAVYSGASQAKVTPSTASKLWVSGQEMQHRLAPPVSVPLFPLLLLLVLVVPTVLCRPAPQCSPVILSSNNFSLRHLRRFLRPPPARG